MSNDLQKTIGLPSTDNRTWDAEYNVGDIVKVRSDFDDITKGLSVYRKIISYFENSYAERPENPKGRLYSLEEGGSWEGKDLEPMPISQPTKVSNIPPITTQSTSQSGIGLYQSSLLTALNVSPNVQAILSKDILDSAYVIYEIQKLYAQTPEGDRKNQLALAIAEGSRILLSEINKISINKPIQSIPSKKQYEVGDMFRVKDDTDEIPKLILRISSINNSTISLDAYIVIPKNAYTPSSTEGIAIRILDDLVNSGEYIPFDYTKIVNVGDIFKVVGDPLDPPEFTKEVTNIEKAKNEVIYDVKYSKNTYANLYGKNVTIIYFISTIKAKLFEKYIPKQNVVTPPTPPPPVSTPNYKVGDKFKDGDDTEVPPRFIYTITAINQDGLELTIFFKSTNKYEDINYKKDIWEQDLRNGDIVPYVEPTTVASTPPQPPTPPSPPTPPTPPSSPKPPSTPPTPPTPPKTQKPKTQKPKTPPKPPTPPSMPQLSCQEIKEAIKGLTLLAKLGDDESIQTIKTLKDTLKTQNCK